MTGLKNRANGFEGIDFSFCNLFFLCKILNPQVKIITPHEEIFAPQAKTFPPHEEAFDPQAKIFPPHEETFAPQVKIFPPHEETFDPQVKIFPPLVYISKQAHRAYNSYFQTIPWSCK